MSILDTKRWFEQAIPDPTTEQVCIQIGCHLEEVGEMLDVMIDDESCAIHSLAENYKQCEKYSLMTASNLQAYKKDKDALLDSLVDQIVTAVGVGHMMGMDVVGALCEVNRSNYSKFEDGKPVFNEQGKISKGKDYTPPNLTPFIGE